MGWLSEQFDNATEWTAHTFNLDQGARDWASRNVNTFFRSFSDAYDSYEINGLEAAVDTLTNSLGEWNNIHDREAQQQYYENRNNITVDWENGKTATVINFQRILDDGEVYYGSGNDERVWNLTIDWDADDAFTRAVDTIEQNSVERINSNPDLQSLLAKGEWDLADRTRWESEVSQIVSEEMDKIPGMDQYRSAVDFVGNPMKVDRTSSHLNDMSEDIENGTSTIEFDCDKMTVVEGSVLQRIDNKLLPADTGKPDYKHTSNYFSYGGDVEFEGITINNQSVYGHGYIISSATGNIIEATIDPSQDARRSYVATNMDFLDMVLNEGVIATNDGRVYGGILTTEEISSAKANPQIQPTPQTQVAATTGSQATPDGLAQIKARLTVMADSLDAHNQNPEATELNEAKRSVVAQVQDSLDPDPDSVQRIIGSSAKGYNFCRLSSCSQA